MCAKSDANTVSLARRLTTMNHRDSHVHPKDLARNRVKLVTLAVVYFLQLIETFNLHATNRYSFWRPRRIQIAYRMHRRFADSIKLES